MLSQPEPACLVIADISGYTGFLAGAELDHAQDVLADLMSTVVTAFRPSFRLAKLEGDAAFVFAITESVDGPLLQDTIERCYFAFRRRLRDVGQASSCECNACILVPKLDLKVVAHYGRVVQQRIATSAELVGSDVIVVHRLLKNHVEEATGFAAYALYSAACVAAMDLHEPAEAGLVEHREAFEGIGEVVGWVRDLQAAWEEELRRASLVVAPKDTVRAYEVTVAAAPAMVWEWATSPTRRPRWQVGVEAVLQQGASSGRRGTGTVNHCIHGKDMIVEEVLDWQPYDHVTYRSLLPIPDVPKLVNSFVFNDLGDGGTRVEVRLSRPRSAKDRAIAETLMPMLDVTFHDGLAALKQAVEAEVATGDALDVPAEPDLPVSLGRNAIEPVARVAS
ncbi:MAG TPA: DUF2652 domain-containing protein [Verrucomicrobiae bacterium]|nr:DUF2652 domain-containing protein [Verrucomicrobiae bacterium]